MTTFQKCEIWTDYWCYRPLSKLDLSKFELLDFYTWYDKKRYKIEINIESTKDSMCPLQSQVDTFSFIIDNQEKILNSLYKCYEEIILPVYKSAQDVYEDEIANCINDLNIVFGLRIIEIPEIQNRDKFLFFLKFDFKYDQEHGLYLLFLNDKIIDFFGEGEKSLCAMDLFENGKYENYQELIKIGLYKLSGETVLKDNYFFTEPIPYNLKKGTYRAFINIDNNQIVRNFFIPEDLNNFTLKSILTN